MLRLHTLLLRRAWNAVGQTYLPLMGLAVLLALLASLPFLPKVLIFLLLVGTAACVFYVYWQLLSYTHEHPELEVTQVVPLEDLNRDPSEYGLNGTDGVRWDGDE